MAAEDLLFILYTSGSTGKPKGVVHTCGGYMVYAGYSFANVFQYQPGDVYWCTADIGWITGHSYIVYGPMLNGATTVMFEGVPTWPTPARFWEVCEKLKVNQFYTAPTAIRALMACAPSFAAGHDLSALKVIGSVGEPINEEAWQWYHDVIGGGRCALVDTWWQTETGGILISGLGAHSPMKPALGGLPLPGIEPVLVDGDGNTQDGEAEGYLCIKRPWPSRHPHDLGDHDRCRNVYFSAFKGKYFTGDGARRDARTGCSASSGGSTTWSTSAATASAPPKSRTPSFAPRRGRERGHRLPAPHQGPGGPRLRHPQGGHPTGYGRGHRRLAQGDRRAGPHRNRQHRPPGPHPVHAGPAQDAVGQDHAPHPPQGGQRRTRPARRHLHAARPDGRRRPRHRRRRIPPDRRSGHSQNVPKLPSTSRRSSMPI